MTERKIRKTLGKRPTNPPHYPGAARARNHSQWAYGLGLGVDVVIASPLPGPAGNVEYFVSMHAARDQTTDRKSVV